MHILHTIHYTFPKVQTRAALFNLVTLINVWFKGDIVRGELDANHSYRSKD